ncbi:MAG: hypothetical protein ABI855_10745 [Bacteroidota bacterium]
MRKLLSPLQKLFYLILICIISGTGCKFHAGQRALYPQPGSSYKTLYPAVSKDSVTLSWETKTDNPRKDKNLYDIKIWEVSNSSSLLANHKTKNVGNQEVEFYHGLIADQKNVRNSIFLPLGYFAWITRWPSSWGTEVYSATDIAGGFHKPDYAFIPGKAYVWAVQRKQGNKSFGWSSTSYDHYYFVFDLKLQNIPYGFVIK